MRLLTRFCLLALCLPALAASQTREPATSSPPPKQEVAAQQPPGTLDAAALRYGAELEERASPALKKWAKSYAKKKLKKGVPDLNAVRAAVDSKYPTADEKARQAAMYLVLYAAYQRQLRELARYGQAIAGPAVEARPAPTGNPGGRTDRNSGPTQSGGQMTPAQGNASTSSGYLFGSNTGPSGPFFEPSPVNWERLHEHIRKLRARLDVCGQQLSEVHKGLGDTPVDAIRGIP